MMMGHKNQCQADCPLIHFDGAISRRRIRAGQQTGPRKVLSWERTPRFTEFGKIPNCGKLVKLFSYGTKVLSHISRHFHPYTLKDFWRFLVLDLVYLTGA
jgi:hypothetical protein